MIRANPIAAKMESSLGKVIESHLIEKDSPEAMLTFEEGMKLLGLKEWPEDWEHWKVGIFLDALTSIHRRKGETWVRFHRKSVLEELWHLVIL